MNKYIKAEMPATFSLDDGDLPKFKIVANTGSVMTFGNIRYALDVERITLKQEKIPILYDHITGWGIGHAEKVYAENGKLIVEGVVSRETSFARDFVSGARNGFPWQASVGGLVVKTTNIKKGEKYDLHGAIVDGPVKIIDEFTLFEVSVVEFGADDKTSSTITACDDFEDEDETVNDEVVINNEEMNMEEEKIDFTAQREAEAAEMERVAEIKARAQSGDEKLVAQAIREGWSPDQFELQSLRANRQSPPAPAPQSDELAPETFEAVALRACGFNVDRKYSDQVLTAADKLGRFGLKEFVARAAGVSQRDSNWIQAAFSTTSLNYILSRTVDAILLQAFDYVDNGWKKAFKIGSVSDFKTAKRYRLNSDLTYQPLADGGNIKHGQIEDEAFDAKADTYATMFALTRKDIINDDLGALTELPRQFGYAAAETINSVAWKLFMNPANVGGNAFYYASAGTLKASCPLTLDNLSAARAAFFTKTKKSGAPLGIPPTILVVPTSLEDKALMLTKATQLNNGTTSDQPADYNPQYGRFQVVGVPYLEYASYSGYSSTSWYLLADPNRCAAFEVAFLNGKTAPTVEKAETNFDTLGIQYRAYIDFGVSQQDQRGILKCTA